MKLKKILFIEYIRCCICGDSKNTNHGHLYISKKYPVAYCFKCGCAYTIKFIEDTIHEQCHIDYNPVIQYELPDLNISKILSQMHDFLEMYSVFITDQEKEYFRKRVKLKSISKESIIKFSLFPDYYSRLLLYNTDNIKYKHVIPDSYQTYRTWTIRGFGTSLAGRTINDNINIRYLNGDIVMPWSKYLTIDCYFIRSSIIKNYNISNVPDNLIICEGVYDCVPLYLNRNKYLIDEKNSLFVAVQCSSYIRALKLFNLLYDRLPKNVVIFADSNITPNILQEQFKKVKNNIQKIIINWPCNKDWEEVGPIKFSMKI